MRTRFYGLIYLLGLFSTSLWSNNLPQDIIEQWQNCQEKHELDSNCLKLGHQVLKIKTMIESLEFNPQAFGLEIMKIQNQLNQKQISEIDRKKLNDELNLRLTIVGWLESPK